MRWSWLLLVLGYSVYTDSLQEGLSKLYPTGSSSFAFVDAELASPEVFSQLSVTRDVSIKCVGELEGLHTQLMEAITEAGNTDKALVEAAALELVALTNRVLTSEGYTNGVVMFRAFTPSDCFVVPRWHMDGNYFKPWGQNPPKFVMTLKGPGTLLLPSDCQRSLLFTDKGSRRLEEDREKVAARFSEHDVLRTKALQGVVFLVGNDYAAVHSEPDINVERMFISIMGATDEQIQQMTDRGF